MEDTVARRLAAFQVANDGLITRSMALEVGLSVGQLTWRLRSGSWLQVYWEVYASVGLPMTDHRRHRAALLAVGPQAVLSHRSAAWLHDLGPAPITPELLVPDRGRRRVEGLLIRRSRFPVTSVTRNALRCSGVVRTLFDNAAISSPEQLTSLVDRALGARTVRLDELVRAFSHPMNARIPGRVRLARELERRHLTDVPAPSVLESEFRRLLERNGLPVPTAELSWRGGKYRLDFADTERRVAIEVDGFAFHSRPAQMQADYQRRNQLAVDGWTLLLFTWTDVVYDPRRVVETVREAFAARAGGARGELGPGAAGTSLPEASREGLPEASSAGLPGGVAQGCPDASSAWLPGGVAQGCPDASSAGLPGGVAQGCPDASSAG